MPPVTRAGAGECSPTRSRFLIRGDCTLIFVMEDTSSGCRPRISRATTWAVLALSWGLLTGCAGSLIEASRIGADVAVFLTHVFISDAVDERKVQLNDCDYIRFLEQMGCTGSESIQDGTLIGPLTVPGGLYVPSDIPLYVGKIKTQVSLY